MTFYRFYMPSVLFSALLTIAAVISLLPLVGVSMFPTYAPASTLTLLCLAGINCLMRGEFKRRQFGTDS